MNFDCELGVGWEHYHIYNVLWNDNASFDFPSDEHYFNYHFRLRYDNEDNHYFPNHGIRAEARYAYYTDNMGTWKGHSGLSDVMAMFQATIPLSRTTHLRPCVQTRMLFGDDRPMMVGNMIGGMSYGRFFPQQMPMAGMAHVEMFDGKFVSASLRLQQQLFGRHYLLLNGSVAEHSNELKYLFDEKPVWGAEIGYFYNSSFIGPLGAALRWNNHTHRVNFFISLGFDF